MEPQKPAVGISKGHEFKDSTYFNVPCECGCDAAITFSVDIDDDAITAHLYTKTETNFWRNRFSHDYKNDSWLVYAIKNKVNDWYNRLAVAWAAITKGYVETEGYVLLSEQQAVNFSAVLVDSVEEFRARQTSTINNNSTEG